MYGQDLDIQGWYCEMLCFSDGMNIRLGDHFTDDLSIQSMISNRSMLIDTTCLSSTFLETQRRQLA